MSESLIYECVGGPLDGQKLSFEPDIHDSFEYTPRDLDQRIIHGSVRYNLRRGDDGVRRLYFAGFPKGILG